MLNKILRSTSVDQIIDQLRSESPFVLALRASGKTTALVHFCAERMLLSNQKANIVVVVPSTQIGYCFSSLFNINYPNLKPIEYATPTYLNKYRGLPSLELYLEEFKLLSDTQLAELKTWHPWIKGGVSSVVSSIYGVKFEEIVN